MILDTSARIAAVRSRDVRFDGFFYLGVTSTGIYCRPSCPARVPKEGNMRFYPSAAAAQGAGYRACKRCRPDATAGSPLWHERGDLVARVMRLIADGVVDREGVGGLAAHVGYSERQIERLVTAELGAGPLALARAQRAQTARVLIETTTLPMAQVAYAAGFASIRSFNDTLRAVFASTPRELRATRRNSGTLHRTRAAGHPTADSAYLSPSASHRISLRLPFRGPLHADSLFGHLAATVVPRVEQWVDDGLARSLALAHGPAVVHLSPREDHVAATVWLSDVRDLTAAMQRARRMLDLDADPWAADEHLALDPVLAPLVRARPGVRIPGSMDPAEMAIRVVLSQHISTRAASTLTARFVEALGEPLPSSVGQHAGHWQVDRLFPTPAAIAEADPSVLPGMPPTRLRTVRVLSAALADGSLSLSAGVDWGKVRNDLLGMPGVGPWTAQMIALRALGDPDAFPATDLGVRRTAAGLGLPEGQAALLRHSARWQPWRGYVTQTLWAASEHAAARMPPPTERTTP
ncbi:MAG: AlkA N-terminal domain-containing protein [Ornithinimicrobium sp.]